MPEIKTIHVSKSSVSIIIWITAGMTIEYVMVDLGLKERSVGLAYCGLSRAKSIHQIAFDGAQPNTMPSFERFTSYYHYKYFIEVQAEEKRLDELAEKTMENYRTLKIMEDMDIDEALDIDEAMETDSETYFSVAEDFDQE